MPSRKDAPVYAAPGFSWTGFYIGVNGGYGGDEFKYPASLGSTTAVGHLTSGGFLGGGQIGYNYQVNQWVLGLEADIDASAIKGDVGASGALGGFLPFTLNAGSKLNDLGTVRARLGVTPVERFLVYATGGYAYGGVTSYANASVGNSSFGISKSTTGSGWVVGAGFEYAVTNHWTVKSEYLYTDLGTANLYNGLLGRTAASLGVTTTANIVRVGVNYKFGEAEPVVAKY